VKFPKVVSRKRQLSGAGNAAFRSVGAPMLTIAVLTAGIAPTALAQRPPGTPEPPQGSPIPHMAPPQLPSVSPYGINLSPLQEGEVPNVSIPVNHVEIVGASLFNDQLQPLLSGLTGPAVPLPRLNDARQEILRYYRSRGYALTSVALAVDQKSGFVRFTVTEGRIAAVKLDGDIGPAGLMVLRFLERLTQYPVIDTATLERWLLLAQDVPGVSLSTVLEPSKEEPGALTLIAQVSLKHYSGQASLDNRAYYLTGPIEGLGILDFNSFTSWGDRTELSYFHSFPSSQDFAQLSSEWFIGSSGLKIKIYGGAGINFPTGSLAALHYAGATDIFGTQLSYPVIRSRRQNLNVYGSLDALESTIDTTSFASGTSTTAQSSADEIRVLRVGEDYIASDLWLGNARPATNQFSTRISQGLELLGGFHGTAVPPSTARQGEQHNFTAIKFETSRTQTLFVPWEGASVALMGLLTGQWTQSILPPAEQFYLGGSRFTRGYYSGQVPGDKALAATAELQLNSTIDLSSLGSRADVASQFYLFYDWGEVWQNLSTDYHARIASAGGGVRLQMTSYVELDLEALGRFNKQPPPLTSPENGIGLYWRLVGRF